MDRFSTLPRTTQRWRWSGRSCHDGPRRLCAPERDCRNHSTAQASFEQAGMAGCPTSHVVFCKPSAVPAWHYTGISGCLFHSWRQNIFACERQKETNYVGAPRVETYPNRFMRGQPSHEHVGLQSAASMDGSVFDPAPSHAALALEWSKLPRRSKSALRSTENAAKEASAVQHAMRKPQKHSGNNSTAQAGPDCFATCYAQMRALWGATQASPERIGSKSGASQASHTALALEWSKLPRRSKSALRSTENAAKEASAFRHAMRKPQKDSGNRSGRSCCNKPCRL